MGDVSVLTLKERHFRGVACQPGKIHRIDQRLYRHTRPEYLRVLEQAVPAESAPARPEAAKQTME